MVASIYGNAFSVNAKHIPNKANLGHAIELRKIEADRLCKHTSKHNFARKQARRKRIQSERIQAHNNKPCMKPFTRFVVTDNAGKQYANEVKTKVRFNPTRTELMERKAKGLEKFISG